MQFPKGSPQLVSLAESRGAVGPPGSRSSPPTLDKHLLDYLRVLSKRRWVAITTLFLAIGLAMLHLYRAVPIYESTAQILIEHENAKAFSLRDSVEQDRQTTDYYNTQYTILQSRSLAKRALNELNAWKHAEFTGDNRSSALRPTSVIEGVTSAVFAGIARLRGSGDVEAAPAAETPESAPAAPVSSTAETPEQSAAISAFLSRLTISPIETSRLVDVKVRARTPKFAADAANALAQTYIDQNLEVRMASSKETSDWLTQQLDQQRQRIEASENALQQYRERHDAVSLQDRQNIVAQKLTDLNAMVTRAKADRISREALYNQVRAIQTRQAPLDTLPAILSNSYLQQLKSEHSRLQAQYAELSQELGERNPRMIALRTSITDAESKLEAELSKQVAAMRNELEAAQTLENRLTEALDAQKGEVVQLNRTGIDYGVLERELSANREIFESLLARTRERGIAGELKASEVRVIDAAQLPHSPIWPNRQQTLFYAAFFGLLLGVGLAFVFEYMDDRLKTPEEIRQYLGLPFLGLVPLIDKKDTNNETPLLPSNATPLFTESFRAVRTNVIFSGESRVRTLVITSTGPGEGKTSVACNLAVSLAMTGRRVLLIDMDMRRPNVHGTFKLDQTPGLADLLAGNIELGAALREVSVPGLWIMPSGARVGNPAELLSSPAFTELLTTVSEKFHWVIIDSPPVAAVTDAAIVAHIASAVLFVIGADQTRRSAALNALEHLETANATFLGAVLNRVHLRRDSYYYSSYYRPAYEQYHVMPGTGEAARDAGTRRHER